MIFFKDFKVQFGKIKKKYVNLNKMVIKNISKVPE